MWWVVWAVTVVVTVTAYLTWTAARVDRLHGRARAAQAALGAQLARRAAAASALAEVARLPTLAQAARLALDARPEEREAVENDLTRQLRAAICDPVLPAVMSADGQAPVVAGLAEARVVAGLAEARVVAELVEVSRRVALARQVHNDVVRDALAVRLRLSVRIFRLARNHPPPSYFDVDDPSLDHLAKASAGEPVAGPGVVS